MQGTLSVLNISGNNITSLSYLAPLKCLQVLNATNNKLNNISDVCDAIKGWYYLHEAMLAGNPMCKQHRWKEKIIAITKKLGKYLLYNSQPFFPRKPSAILDKKDINDTTRVFIQRLEHEKEMQKSCNYMDHIPHPPGR